MQVWISRFPATPDFEISGKSGFWVSGKSGLGGPATPDFEVFGNSRFEAEDVVQVGACPLPSFHCRHCGSCPFCLTVGAVHSRQVEDAVEDVDSDPFLARFLWRTWISKKKFLKKNISF